MDKAPTDKRIITGKTIPATTVSDNAWKTHCAKTTIPCQVTRDGTSL